MYKFRCLVCLMLLYGLGFGSQPDECLFKKQHLVISLDWHKEISRPNSIASSKYYFFNRGISNFTLNDTIQMQSLQTDARKVTFGKIALESLGAIGGGYLITNICRRLSLFYTSDAPWWAPSELCWGDPHYLIGFSLGSALSVSLTGNYLLDSQGSFLKSCIGSTTGSLLGAGLFVLSLARFGGADDVEYEWLIVDEIVLLVLPVTGAVIGYNLKSSSCCLTSMRNQLYNQTNQSYSFSNYSCKIPLISINF